MTAGYNFAYLDEQTKRMIIVLNDNEWSIAKNVGAIANYLNKIATHPTYAATSAASSGGSGRRRAMSLTATRPPGLSASRRPRSADSRSFGASVRPSPPEISTSRIWGVRRM